MALSGTIKVSTDQLLSKADLVNARIDDVNRCLEQMKNKVQSSRNYWIGEAGDLYRKVYEEKEPMLEEILKRFEEHSKDLVNMAKNYENAEQVIEETMVQQLPDNVIV